MAKASDNVFPKVILGMQTSNPSAPSDSSWKTFAKADGIYARSSNTVVGPFGAGGSLTVSDEGGPLATAATTLDFVGSGVTASGTGATKTITIPGGGTPTFVGARAERTTAQSINNASLTAIQFNATDGYDTSSIHDPASNNTRMTAPSTGYYLITAVVQWAANTSGSRLISIRKDGATTLAENEVNPNFTAVDGQATHISVIASLSATNYIEVMVYQTSGGALNTRAAAEGCHVTMGLMGT